MAGIAVGPDDQNCHEIVRLEIYDGGWEVVTKDKRRFGFKGQPFFAENIGCHEKLMVDVRRGLVLLPSLQPIPHNIFDPGEKALDKGSEYIEKF